MSVIKRPVRKPKAHVVKLTDAQIWAACNALNIHAKSYEEMIVKRRPNPSTLLVWKQYAQEIRSLSTYILQARKPS